MPRGKYERYPSAFAEYVTEHANEDTTITELWENMKRDVSPNIPREYVRGRIRREHLPFKKGTGYNTLLTDEQADQMIAIIPGRSSEEISKIMLEKYGVEISPTQVRGWKKNHRAPSGYDARFRPGNASPTKGKKRTEFLSPEMIARIQKTQFKKGNVPKNRREVGEIIERCDGYLWIKTQDWHQNDNWQQYHRWLWEQVHGPIPEGFRVYFLDGDRTNCKLENLMLVSDEALGTANKWFGLTSDPEINKTIISTAELKMATTKAMNRRKGE